MGCRLQLELVVGLIVGAWGGHGDRGPSMNGKVWVCRRGSDVEKSRASRRPVSEGPFNLWRGAWLVR